MRFMTNYNFGDVVLIAFPFTNFAKAKKRPALILFDSEDNDLIICRITSQISNTKYDVPVLQWQDCGLLSPSWIRLHKIATLEKTIINSTLGKLKGKDLKLVQETIRKIILFHN